MTLRAAMFDCSHLDCHEGPPVASGLVRLSDHQAASASGETPVVHESTGDPKDMSQEVQRLDQLLATLAEHVGIVTSQSLPPALEELCSRVLSPEPCCRPLSSPVQNAAPTQGGEDLAGTLTIVPVSATADSSKPLPVSPSVPAEVAADIDAAKIITGDELDVASEYQVEESVWSLGLFVGIDAMGFFPSLLMIITLALSSAIQISFCVVVQQP